MAKAISEGQAHEYGRGYQCSSGNGSTLPYNLKVTLTQLQAVGATSPDRGKTIEEILVLLKDRQGGTTLTSEELTHNLRELLKLQSTQETPNRKKEYYICAKSERGMRYWLGRAGRNIATPNTNYIPRFDPGSRARKNWVEDGRFKIRLESD